MAPSTRTAQSAPSPSTPSKSSQTDRAVEIIEKLNRDYNLSIEIPDVTLTPISARTRSKHDTAFARSAKIIGRFRIHCWKQPAIIDTILHSFYMEARAASQRWLRPVDHSEPCPSTPPPPKAASPGEALVLQEVLVKVLDRAKEQVKAIELNPIDHHRPQSGQTTHCSADLSESKRRPTDGKQRGSSKRAKPSPPRDRPVGEPIAGALDQVPSRSKSARPGLTAAIFRDVDKNAKFKAPSTRASTSSTRLSTSLTKASTSVRDSFYGSTSIATTANTSRTSIFSIAEDELPATQETIPTPSGDERAFNQRSSQDLASSQSLDPFPASSGDIDALNVSFTAHDVATPARLFAEPLPPVTPPAPASPSLETVYSEVSGLDNLAPHVPLYTPPRKRSEPVDLHSRLEATWPRFPPWLNRAPFAVAWEITRIALHCRVDLGEVQMTYDETWWDYNDLSKALVADPLFSGKSFPERPEDDAWLAALSPGFRSPKGQHAVFSASLDQTRNTKSGPIFALTMQPITLDIGCRLHRRFGSDRFLDLLIPAPNSWQRPLNNPVKSREVVDWFSSGLHYLAGRQWRTFFSKDAGYRTPQRNDTLGPDSKPIFKDRLYLFAENGHHFHEPLPISFGSSSPNDRVKLEVCHMLDWLLQLDSNGTQPYLKLFSRIQLGLSKTIPVVELYQNQIINRAKDLRSPTGEIMNDGIGRMSEALARKVKDVVGLTDVPSAIQGRFGPAKGMWIIDTNNSPDELWLETWPSQRKWNCDFEDAEHRTLEFRSHAAEPRSASLNVQFLPVLEDRAADKAAMRKAIGDSLVDELNREFEKQKNAMDNSLKFRQWVNEISMARKQRMRHNRVTFLGGLPDSTEETMNFLLDGGFEVQSQKFLQEHAWELRRTACENLKKKMSIKVPNSAYLYMVVDFTGVLAEDEVHICFSSKFKTDSFSNTMVQGRDVLVARSPAHFVSDIQRVKAVFKQELEALKDVVVFSSRGDIPLAQKLSGGDYDGDKAWVCWEPAIVTNFRNHSVPPAPDLSDYLRKDETKYGDLVQKHGKKRAVSEMIRESVAFSMRLNFLGIATNLKEKLCYSINSVNNRYALVLSTLLSLLVDQPKQGYVFTNDDWKRIQKELLDMDKIKNLGDPAYKGDSWSGRGEPRHIIDYLKFRVVKNAIDKELEKLHLAMNPQRNAAEYYDAELAKPYKDFEELASKVPPLKEVLRNLTRDLESLEDEWRAKIAGRKDKEIRSCILEVYESYRAIQPRPPKMSKPLQALLAAFLNPSEENSTWALLRASTAFYNHHKKPKFVWWMAGRQLQYIKSQTKATRDNVPVTVVPVMYAALKPDSKLIAHMISMMGEDGTEYPEADSDAEG
uniref:RNA-dependent RNA polymerase n=1 Tax=Colletotrichum lindemuthianum TaxID=290576 RepID=A0A0P0HQF4_COLLN|nr:RNA-dependent RNA polymerase [Colletotrichum lindemuthianum]ALJ83739.1 RNA-dependent RNA polymerase [Colletotrichum lindemuthianum]